MVINYKRPWNLSIQWNTSLFSDSESVIIDDSVSIREMFCFVLQYYQKASTYTIINQ